MINVGKPKGQQVMRTSAMSATFLVMYCVLLFDVVGVLGDVGTAASYDPPYLPTRCGGYSEDQFPPGELFAAVSDGLWDNGASCGRKYRVRCISGPKRPCKVRSIVVQVVDLCSHDPCPATMQLSNKAFNAISKIDAKVNVEYAQI
ncbi:EG45-like domain containing protein [Gossypium australe]|uniref:EG45-like domain containing protein n=1 Tax=Gossypium australe TaxID=47621 RepID=A0A5B6WZ98_9ROSI|nr:EG45-like domain containing protein [Gossypium australe]